MNSWKVILATMVIFGAGVITGGLLVKNTPPGNVVVVPRNPARFTNQPPISVASPQMMRMEFLLRARNELQLSPEQHERVEKIIREGQERSRKLWESVAPEMRKELQLVHERIRAELTPEQRRKFEQMLKNPPRQPGNPDNPQMPPERMRDRLRPASSSPRSSRRASIAAPSSTDCTGLRNLSIPNRPAKTRPASPDGSTFRTK